MKLIRLLLNFFKWLIIIAISVIVLYMLSSNFTLFGGYRTYVVQSGSMEPAIMTGDVILIQDKDKYAINDVITFKEQENRLVTHRIVNIESDAKGNIYSTKGDANRTGDENAIVKSQIIGKVRLVIPRLGYLISFIKSPRGYILLIIIPAIIFILDELVKVKKNVKTRN